MERAHAGLPFPSAHGSLAMIEITYRDLVLRFGDRDARAMMRSVERVAQLPTEIVIPLDQEQRFRRALEALNKINFAA